MKACEQNCELKGCRADKPRLLGGGKMKIEKNKTMEEEKLF